MEFTDFRRLLVQYTGLTMTDSDQNKLEKFLRNRLAELKLGALPPYLELLSAGTLSSDLEWQRVVQALTVPESFFLRDKGQMRILREHLLPELIRRNQDRRQLRLWSAGCSTGEEPYSLALLLQELLPDGQGWEVLILGTDINDKALAKAKAGVYSSWSLRDAGAEVSGYFRPAPHGLLALDASIRNKVTFRRVNLLQMPFPDFEINGMDLILCRNVFIYFDQPAIAIVLEKFKQSLNPHGYLMTGHGELYQQTLNGLQSQLFPESVVYQRKADKASAHTPVPHGAIAQPTATLANRPVHSPVENRLQAQDAEDLGRIYRRGDYAGVLAIAQKRLLHSVDFEAHYWSAKAFASLGQYHTAEIQLQAALALNVGSARCYYLLAHIRESQDDTWQAKILLNKVIELDEEFIPAYLELAQLYGQEDLPKHQEMCRHALRLLNKLPPEYYLEDFAAHARDLIQQLH